MSDNIITQFTRAERTPEAAAVSLYETRGGSGFSDPPFVDLVSVEKQTLGAQGATPPQSYKDYVDTSSKDLHGTPFPACAKWVSVGKCEQGHKFAKVHLCGKEWCPECGAKDSWIHNRRFSRWLPKAQQMQDIGYFVIEWPIVSRGKLHSKRALSDMGKRVKGAFQVLGFDRGFRRWHFFGESGLKFNPHINVLVDSAYLSRERLDVIKSHLRSVLGEPDLIINYSYRQSVAEKIHTLKYVTRATFIDESWDDSLVHELHNFQNTNRWGKWDDPPVWQMSHEQKGVKALESGKCPHCGTPVHWESKPVSIAWLQIWQAAGWVRDRGGGYFELDIGKSYNLEGG